MQRIGLLFTLCAFLTVTVGTVGTSEAGPPPAYTKEHVITIDATMLHPPSWWYVPGVTPLIWSMDPENTEAYRTSTVRELRLKPGSYRFGTFTFDFPFTVNELNAQLIRCDVIVRFRHDSQRGRWVVPFPTVMNKATTGSSASAVCQVPLGLIA